MRKLFLIGSLLVMIMFLISCAPQLTDEELEAELAKLTPEQREALLKDIEEKEKNPLAGQAVSVKYGISSKVGLASSKQIQAAMKKLITPVPSCTDSDGYDRFVKGHVNGLYENNSYYDSYDYCRANVPPSYPNFVPVYACQPPDCDVVEYYCEGILPQSSSQYDCENGCSNGACL